MVALALRRGHKDGPQPGDCIPAVFTIARLVIRSPRQTGDCIYAAPLSRVRNRTNNAVSDTGRIRQKGISVRMLLIHTHVGTEGAYRLAGRSLSQDKRATSSQPSSVSISHRTLVRPKLVRAVNWPSNSVLLTTTPSFAFIK
ncbi:unnamed protein product [Protopolystoma xenopodis]|uniref:Uncharacterized protein n=1 Tax=Protopolystoma xenopodis TaxID=117903 RepID=A0A448XSL2_9PLAT|nr:unnamed protein product [Protopolystoma xenopodis]